MRYLNFIPLLMAFASLSLPALEDRDLYETEVPVADQSAGARSAALAQAMSAVLLKVSGNSGVLAEESLQAEARNAARYVQQYRYRNATAPSPTGESLLLWARFDAESVKRMLRQYGFAIWGTARPTLLVWLAVEEQGKREVVGANDRGQVHDAIESEAVQRALPVRLPLLDLTDQGQVRPVDIWGGFFDTIMAASERYEAQAVLVGKLYPRKAGQWEVRWTLLHRGAKKQWQQQAKDAVSLVTAGVDSATDYLSQSFAERLEGGSGVVQLRIDGVRGMDDYRRITDYLRSLHGVSAITLQEAAADSLLLQLQVEGGSDLLTQSIALGDVLVRQEVISPLSQPPLPPAQSGESGSQASSAVMPPPELHYRLIP